MNPAASVPVADASQRVVSLSPAKDTREDVWRGIISEVILALFRVANLDRHNFVPRMAQAARQFGAFLGKGFLQALAHTDVKLKAEALGSGGELSVKGEMFRDIYDEFDTSSQPQKAFLNRKRARSARDETERTAYRQSGQKQR